MRIWPIYRCLFIMIFSLFFAGVCVKILRKYRVNYVSIFGIEPANRMNEYQFYKLFLYWQSLLSFTLLVEVLNIKGYVNFGREKVGPASWPTLTLIVLMILIMVNPFSYGYKKFRHELLLALYYTVVAPFGLVRFKDFFFGDILTSMVKPFIDIIFIANYFNFEQNQISGGTSPAWRNMDIKLHQCSPSNMAILVVSLLPFHFRFWQCIYKYNETGLWFPNLVNAGKYFAGMMVIFFSYLVADGSDAITKEFYVKFAVFSTLYSYSWDIVMDWGLLRGTRGFPSCLLRDRIKYPPSFYYFSAVTNLALRFAWALPLIDNKFWSFYFSDSFNEYQILFFLLAFGETYRRAQWSLFRVENENINNYEKYRAIHEIPKVIDDRDDDYC